MGALSWYKMRSWRHILHQSSRAPSVFTMHFLIIASLAAAASAAPQLVPYVHEEIAAEPYIHQEVAAEEYVHIEPALTAEALGQVAPGFRQAPVQQFAQQPAQQYAPQQFAQPAQQFAPQQFAAPSGPVGWAGYCINNLGEGVPCRQQF